MDFAEQLESVAYVLCGEGTVTYEKFCQIWHAKGVRYPELQAPRDSD